MGITGGATSDRQPGGTRQRVLLVHDSHEFGGLEVVIIEFLRRLDPSFEAAVLVRGHQHTTWTSPKQLVDAIENLGTTVLRPQTPRTRSGMVNRASEWWSTLCLIRRFRPDIVHIHTATVEGGRTQTVLARLAGARIVLRTEHNSPTAYSRKPFASWSRRLTDYLTATIITVSDHDRDEQIRVVGRRPEQVVCILNGVDTDRFAPRPSPGPIAGLEQRGQIVVGTHGRLSEQKGHRYLVAAAAELVAAGVDIEVVIGGEGELHDHLAYQIAQLGMINRVHLIGKVDDVPRFLASIDIAVMPSLHEGLSLALLEMMSMARPTIVSDHPGLTEAAIADVTSIVVPLRTPVALAEAIAALASDSDRRREYGAAGRDRVIGSFSHERYMRDVENLYRATRTRDFRRVS